MDGPAPTDAHELEVKLYAREPFEPALHELVPIFHEWIQNDRLEGELLIDVADYAHVHHGPGVLLIGHAAQYGLDVGEGRPGLLYRRRREAEGAVRARLHTAFRSALRACRLLEREPALRGRLRFRTDEALLRIQNRLLAPNTPEVFEAVRDELAPVLAELYRGAARIATERAGGPGDGCSIRIAVEGAPDLETLLGRAEDAAGRRGARRTG
jgi:hypothetical protein